MPEKPERHATRYFAWLYSPPPQRSVLEALCGIESEIGASLSDGLDHRVSHLRLQWWREECERCARGQPAHPLTRTLVAVYGGTPRTDGRTPDTNAAGSPTDFRVIPQLAGLSGFVDTAVWDLAAATFATRRELTDYCERWAAAMIEPAAAIALPGGSTHDWRGFGATLREIEVLADLAGEAHSGRLRLPLDELERAGSEPTSLATPPWPTSLARLLSERHEALRTALAESIAGLGRDEQPALRGLLVWAALASHLSRRAQRALPNPIRARRVDALADGWLAWRAARRALTGKFRLS